MVSDPIPPSAPVPVNATWHPGIPTQLTVDFDQDLVTVPVLDTGNWTAIINNIRRTCLAASSLGPTVTLTMKTSTPQVSPNVVTFLPPPHDVVGLLNGLPAQFIINFPVT